ncbi:MAG: rod shape-determining protein MreC [Planctomycetota bacterium]
MIRYILGHVLRAATRYPTLSLLVLFGMIMLVPAVTSALENVKTALTTPLGPLGSLDAPAADLPRLQQQHELTRQELAAARLEIARLQRHLDQSQRLIRTRRDGELVPERLSANLLPASNDSSPYRHTLLIDRGSREGLQIGDPVVNGRVLIGRVVAVGPMTSRVQLVTDPGFHGVKILIVPATDDLATAAEDDLDAFPRGLAHGDGDRDMMMMLEHVPQDSKVAVGDLVFTSAHSVTTPGGLIIGRISRVSRSERAQFASIEVEPWADPRRIEQVQVIRWPRSLQIDVPTD